MNESTDKITSSAAPLRAPELALAGIEWLNVDHPLTLRELRGRVVIGVHSPKYDAERELDNVRQAVLRHRVTHPVAHDPQRLLWGWGGGGQDAAGQAISRARSARPVAA